MRKLLVVALVHVSASLFAQTDVKKVEEMNLDTLEVIAPAGAVPYQPAAPHDWDIKHTRIALSFNYQARTANVNEWIRLSPWFYPLDSLVLDAKTITIDSVELVGKKGYIDLSYRQANDKLYIHFDRKYIPSDTVDLFLKYTSHPYATTSKGSAAIRDDRGLYFINTDGKILNKPMQIWTQGETESNSHWMVTIDKPNMRFTTQIELTVPDTFVTLSNGALIKQTPRTGHLRTDVWKMDMPIQPYAAMFAIGKFSVVKDKWRNKEVNYYVEPPYAPHASAMFKNTPEMMEYFSKRTGVPFPWNKYSQVVVRDYISGAMENTTASLFGEFTNQTRRELADKTSEDIVAHELFHQWFGDYATCESWSNITVNESFANYGEQLWRGNKYGKESADELAYNDLQGYIGASQLSDPQLVRYYYDNREDVFDAISYNKGGAILRYLHNLMGDAAFDKAMNTYLTHNALKATEAHHWRMAVEEVTGLDWSWFFNEWYYRAGHPTLRYTYTYNDSLQRLKVQVTQENDDSAFLYRLPLKTAVYYGADKDAFTWNLTRKNDSMLFAYHAGVRPVIVPDAEHVLPGEVKENKKPAQWLTQFINSTDFTSKRLALSGAGRLMSDSSSQELVDIALRDKNNTIRRLALAQLGSMQSDKYRKRWTNKVMEMAKADSNNLTRAEAFNVLGSWKVKDAMPLMRTAVSDSSYTVGGKALEAIGKIEKDTAYAIAKRMLATDPRGTLDVAIWTTIGKYGADEDIVLYEKKMVQVFGNKKFAFVISLNNYLKNVKGDVAFQKAIEVYLYAIISEEMKSYRTSLGSFLFQAAAEVKGRTSSADKDEAATATRRLDMIKNGINRMMSVENDPETVKEYQKSMKSTFE